VILEVNGLTKSFGGLVAVKSLDLKVARGEILGLIGPNGSGKTTVFNLITGLLKPDAGVIKFEGEDITGLEPHVICRRGIARTFQLVRVFPNMTVLQNVMVARLYGREAARSLEEARKECEEVLRSVGLEGKRDLPAGSLTLVERKRLELARALASRPKLLLLDEALAGLNPVETEAALRLIKGIRDSGVTIVMVEHVMKAVMGVCDRVVVLDAGEKIAEGPPLEVARDKRVVEAYLGRGLYA
jgi:branched-chain amino acid transport system ATP-binding protein